MAHIDAAKKELFETAPLPKAIASLAVPTIISQLVTMAYNLADAWFIGRTGNPLMIAAISMAFPVFMMTTGIANTFGLGGGSLLARLMGKGDLERAGRACAFSFYGALLASASYALAVFLAEGTLLGLLGASEGTKPFVSSYLFYVVTLGAVPTVLSMALAHLVRSAGYSREASFGLSMGALLNIFFDPIFMFVLLPSGMEVIGAAVATMLSNIIATLYFVRQVFRLSGNSVLTLSPKRANLDTEGIKTVIMVGLPSGLMIFLLDFANAVQNAAMAAYGDFQMAALGIAMKAERLPISIGLGLCQGSMPLVSYNFSSGNLTRMKRAINMSRLCGICVSLLSVALYQMFAGGIIRLFFDASKGDAQAAMQTIAYGTMFLRVRSCGSIFTFLSFHVTYMLQALGFAKSALMVSVTRLAVFYIGMVFLLDWLFGMQGVIFSQLAGETLNLMLVAFPLFFWCIRQTAKGDRLK